MSVDMAVALIWSAETMFKEFAQRQALLTQTGGQLYPSRVSDEMAAIEQACVIRYGCSPVWLIDHGVITASLTGDDGLVHAVIQPCNDRYRGRRDLRLDVPAKPITCLLCLGV